MLPHLPNCLVGRRRLPGYGARAACLTAFGLFLGGADPGHAQTKGLPLATGGKALQPVVISTRATQRTSDAAQELARYLERMTGARFEVTTGDGSAGIVLGTIDEFPDKTLTDALKVRELGDGKEAFAIRTDDKRLRLLGATDLGASHAAFRFLESLGCRWFFPAPVWEVVPRRPTLTASLQETSRPAILSRRIWWNYGFFDPKENRCRRDYEGWARHNRMAASFDISCGHAWQEIIRQNRDLFAKHPEYLALTKGKRQGDQLCVSNPEVRRLVVDFALQELARRPERGMVSLETSDDDRQCECEACRRLGSVSDRAFGLADEAAREIQKRYPGKMVGMLAYNDHCEPPSRALGPNVYVALATAFIRGRFSFPELLELWPRKARNIGIREYFSVWAWDFDLPPGGRAANLKYLRERLPQYAALGARSVDCEADNSWGLQGLGYYVGNRLMWDPKADVNALLTDFYLQAFGPAAAVMRRYYERFDGGKEPLVGEHLFALALRDLDEAAKLARERPDVLARLDHLKYYLHYVRLRWDHDRTRDKSAKRALSLAGITHVYRTRYSYMNDWQTISRTWAERGAREFGEPSWSYRKPDAWPWLGAEPYTRAETDKLFRDDLARFPVRAVTEVAFSTALLPTGFRTRKPALLTARLRHGGHFGLLSRAGEPLEVIITPGLIAAYRDRADLRYTITDAAGKVRAQGRLPQDGKEHPVRAAVGQAGVYWLEVEDQSVGWEIKAAPGRPVVYALQKGKRTEAMGHLRPLFFYVPRGTRQLHIFWQGEPHEVCLPNGKVLAQLKVNGTIQTLPVPPGADGQVWSFKGLPPGRLWLMNAPNYLAASPDALLVPREVAVRDGVARR
jgi:hypothetical protein